MKALWIALALAAPALAADGFVWKDQNGTSMELTDGGAPVLVYNYGLMTKEGVPANRYRSTYVHPVWAPNGVVVTDDFPKDHYHHRGISWMWPIVKVDGSTYDLWTIKGIHQRFVKWIDRKAGAKSATLAVENGWYLAGDRKVMKETVVLTAHPVSGTARKLDFTLTFEAVGQPVTLRGDTTDSKGYGGFSVRFAPRKNTVVSTDAGREARDTNMAPHPWAQLDADYEGGHAALRIDIDRGNAGYPNGWCLREYGFLGVNYPGNELLTLEPGKPVTLRYQVTLLAPAAR